MKKNFYMISLIMMCLFLNACTIGHRIKKFDALQLTIENLEYRDQAKINYFNEIKDLAILNNDMFAKYDKTYFKEHSLIIITLKDNKDNVYNESGIKNGTIAIDRQVIKDSEITNWTLILEIEDKIPDIENFIVSFNNSKKQIEYIHNYQETVIEPTCQEQGYTNHKCECGEEYKDDFTETVECEYKDGYCIWCEKDGYITLEDNSYIGIKIATTYSYIENNYYTPFELKDGDLYWVFENYGKLKKCINDSSIFQLDSLNLLVLDGYEDIISKINNDKYIYYMANDTPGRLNTSFYLVNYNDDLYLVIIDNVEESVEVNSVNIYLLDDSKVFLYFNDINSRPGDEVYKYVYKNEDYIVDFLSATTFDSDMFIDLETLTIYNGTINCDQHLNLVPYSEEDGVFYTAIRESIFNYGNLHFNSCMVEEKELEKYNKAIYDGINVILEVDNIKYSLFKYMSKYYIFKIEMSNPIFDTYESDDIILSKLFGSDNFDNSINQFRSIESNNAYTIITKKNNSYIIEFGIDLHPYD